MPSYNLLLDHTGATAAPVEFPLLISSPVLVVEVENLAIGNPVWIRSGWVQAVSDTAIGAVRGQPQRVTFGMQEFSLAVPQFPYRIKFMPKAWTKAWRLRVWEREVWLPPPSLLDDFNGAIDLNAIYRKQLDLEAKIDAI
jgi:hypothetical protein